MKPAKLQTEHSKSSTNRRRETDTKSKKRERQYRKKIEKRKYYESALNDILPERFRKLSDLKEELRKLEEAKRTNKISRDIEECKTEINLCDQLIKKLSGVLNVRVYPLPTHGTSVATE